MVLAPSRDLRGGCDAMCRGTGRAGRREIDTITRAVRGRGPCGENLGTLISSLASNSHLHAEAAAILLLQYFRTFRKLS